MHTIHRLDSNLHAKALRKEAERWDRIVAFVGGEWERSWSLKWTFEPVISIEEVMEDLEFGRE